MPISRLRRAAAQTLYWSGAFSISQYLQTPWRILMYHRVVDPETLSYPIQSGMYVRPKTFEMQMNLLKRSYNVIALEQLTSDILLKKKIPHGTVALTFDDGWRDNFLNALPILRSLSLPASIFLPTGFIESSDLFWTDAVALSLSQLDPVQPREELRRSLRNRLPDQTAQAIYQALESDAEITERLEKLLQLLFELPRETRQAALECFYAQIPSQILSELPATFLNWEETREMQAGGFSVGAHSHSHERFGELSADEIDRDLALCRHILSERIGRSLSILCYPGGSFSRTSQEVAKRHGFQATLGVERQSQLRMEPPIFGRIGIHEDISASRALFSLRLWGR